MRPSSSELSAGFFTLSAAGALDDRLAGHMPPIAWLHGIAPVEGTPLIVASPVPGCNISPFPAVVRRSDGSIALGFDAKATIEGILLEEYHSGLHPTMEMKLPFNYSRLPTWIKTLGRAVRGNPGHAVPGIEFPNGDPCQIIQWLQNLMKTSNQTAPPTLLTRWPEGKKAAMITTHDVDTDWIFHHPEWFDRIAGVEADHGFKGAWYCVPTYCDHATAWKGLEQIAKAGCEIGCHGYSHDAKWPLLTGSAFDRRMNKVREFCSRWNAKGFRSEWLYRTPRFLEALAGVFEYDTSVPSISHSFTRDTANGSASIMPYRTHGRMIELPVTIPLDHEQQLEGIEPETFWERQRQRSQTIIDSGGLVVVALHPQGHQAATPENVAHLDRFLSHFDSTPNLWRPRPDELARWCASVLN